MSTRYAESGHAQNDLVSPFEIASLVRRFYSRVSSDDLLGSVFNDVAQVDWSEHLPKLTAFWSRVLLDIPGFNGAPMQAHHRIHVQHEFTSEHFHRWLDLFFDTLDEGWVGPRAEYAKEVAASVARAHALQLCGEVLELEGRHPELQSANARAQRQESRSLPIMPRRTD